MNRPKDFIDYIETLAAKNGRPHEIDRQIYALYGLAPEEIQIEEGSAEK